jgi:hypothetical protein
MHYQPVQDDFNDDFAQRVHRLKGISFMIRLDTTPRLSLADIERDVFLALNRLEEQIVQVFSKIGYPSLAIHLLNRATWVET